MQNSTETGSNCIPLFFSIKCNKVTRKKSKTKKKIQRKKKRNGIFKYSRDDRVVIVY
jgi:hypothetical protein